MSRRKSHRRPATRSNAPSSIERRTLTVGALVASAVTSLSTGQLHAAELSDARLRVVHNALHPHVLGLNAPTTHLADDGAAEQQGTLHLLRVEGGSLQSVASALEAATGVKITLAHESLATLPSPGVRGTFTIEQALREALIGTGVSFRMTASDAALLDIAALSESISVSGSVATVASPKYTVPLRDIPQTIEVIPRAAMESQGVTTLSEALRNVPGITLQAGEGGGASSTAGDMFNMRGFNASNSLFVDNVRDDGLVSRDVFNLEQVEVFMGPTGSDVGRGTAAGYVNMQTKTPHLPPSRSVNLAYGTANQRRASFDINQPLSIGAPDTWLGKSAVRLNALWQDSGVAGRDEVTNETKAIAPSIGLGLGTSTRVLASAQILRQNNLPDYGIPGGAWKENQLAPATQFAARDVDQSNYYGSPDYDYDRANQNTFTARVEHNLNPRWLLTNQTRRNKTDREAVISAIQNPAAFNADTGLVTIARQGNARENSILSNQTMLSGRVSQGLLEHNITSGLEFTREAQFAPTLTGFGTRNPVDIYNPNPNDPVVGMNVTRTGAFTDGSTRTQAMYAFDSMSIGPRIQTNFGLRFEHYNTDYTSMTADGVATPIAADGNLLSGKAGIVYRVRPNANVYASYGTTMTPPGGANFALSTTANNQNNPNVDPQKSFNTEVGAKVDVAGGRLSLTGAYFHTINENVLFTVDAAAVPPLFNQDDKQRVDGVTFGATGQINRNWDVLGSVAYLDTESLTQNAVQNGRRLPLSPTWSGSIWTTYRLPKGFALGGGVRGNQSAFINAANTIGLPGYKLVDLLGEYAVSQHLKLRLNVYNLLDEVYIRSVNNNGGRYNPGYRRTAQLTSAITF